MILLRTLAIWVGCGVASILALRTHAGSQAPLAPEQPGPRAGRIVTLQSVEAEKGPEL